MEELNKRITEIINASLPDESLFLLELKISGNHRLKVEVTLDGDDGITIDQCATVSRKVGFQIEEENIIEKAYNLEVSSPGVDQPLKLKRQYKSKVGKRLEIQLVEGKKKTGELKELRENSLLILEEITQKNKKHIVKKELEILFDDIKETKVLISFK